MTTVTYIESTGYGIIGNSGGPSDIVNPGDRVRFNKDLASHKEIQDQIDAGHESYSHLRIIEVDPEAERAAEKERKELLKKAEKIAADQRQEEARQSQRTAGEGQFDPEGQTVDEVVDYLKQASPDEVQRVKQAEADGKDRSTIADFEPKSDDE